MVILRKSIFPFTFERHDFCRRSITLEASALTKVQQVGRETTSRDANSFFEEIDICVLRKRFL